MKVATSLKKDWVLTPGAFERLLAVMDRDRELAGEKYETVRSKLIEYFEARSSSSPADMADEAINRVARKVEEGEAIQDLNRYFYGVARLLWKETLRSTKEEPVGLDPMLPPGTTAIEGEGEDLRRQDNEMRHECFEACLGKLSEDNRIFIIEYYREEKGVKIEQRKRRAERLRLSLNAVRLRASRIRCGLQKCIDSCLKNS